MAAASFRALRVEQDAEGKFQRHIARRSVDDLPEGDVLIRVRYSALNFKDALSATGNKAVSRNFPHTPGIDAAGVVEDSRSPDWQPGQEVLVTSYDLGMNHDGGFAEYIRVPAEWVVPLPSGLTTREAMILGTAGFTAALCVQAIVDRGITPSDGEVLVTGATGGVGSFAVGILAKAGYRPMAGTGKADAEDWLRRLGAAGLVSREELADDSGKPLLKSRWAGAVDTVGGDVLATTLKCLNYGASVSCCGLVRSPKLETTVMPFILRGNALLGVDSQNTPMELRRRTWERLAGEWKLPDLEMLVSETSLDGLEEHIQNILQGGVRGRVLVDLEA